MNYFNWAESRYYHGRRDIGEPLEWPDETLKAILNDIDALQEETMLIRLTPTDTIGSSYV